MQNKDQQKKIILRNFWPTLVVKKKAITRYTRIYIKLNDRDNTKQAKKLYFHSGPSTKTVEM